MERTRVISSNIAAIGYDAETRVLEIEFLSGSVYQYAGVPASVHNGLIGASSHGQYFDQFVKKAGYSYKQVR